MWAALRFRSGQTAALAVLAALVTACAVFAPVYDRLMAQSLVDVRLASATSLGSGLQLGASSRALNPWDDATPAPPQTPSQLVEELPRWARSSYDAPVLGWTDTLDVQPDRSGGLSGQLMSRTDGCAHVTVRAGRCPRAAGEVLVSTTDVAELGLRPGQRLDVAEPTTPPAQPRPVLRLTVVGAYTAGSAAADWFGQGLTGISGTFTDGAPSHQRHDVWLTTDETFTSQPLPLIESYAGLRLRPERAGVDQVLRLGDTLTALRTRWLNASTGSRLTLTTGLTDIADDVRSQQHDSRVIVPLLMAQLGLLSLVVLWLTLGAVADLRRPEVAVARLRGRGVRGARRMVLGELAPAVLLGVVPGAALAAAGGFLAAGLLPGDALPEVRPASGAALLAAVLVLLATAALAAARVARVPVDALLRRSSSVRRGWRVGVLDAMLIACCAVVVAAFVTGSLDGPAALVAPAVVALLAGLLLAHAFTPTATALGRALLRRGRARGAIALLEAGRSPGLRATVTVVTVAAALAVFAVDAVVVADRNRASAAEQEAGASAVALVDGTDLAGVEKVLGDSRDVTPVVRVKAPAADAVTTLAVRPDDFRRIALLPSGEDSGAGWSRLAGADVAPVTVTGDELSLVVTDRGLTSTASDGSAVTVTLGADLAAGDRSFHTELGALPSSGSRRLSTSVSCASGCRLVGLSLSTVTGSAMAGGLDVSRLRAGGRPVALGDGWVRYEDPEGGRLVPHSTGGTLSLDVGTDGQQRISVGQGWVPQQVPALLTDPTPARGFQLTGLDGRTRGGALVGRLSRVPGAPARTAVVDLDVLRRAATIATDARLELWASDAASLARATDALREGGIGVTQTTTLSDVRRGYDESAAAWSVDLGLLVGLAAVAIALLLLAVLTVSGWRQRARDLASLWLGGVPRATVRTVAWTVQLPAVVVAAVVGTACGLLGAALTMPKVPLFARAPGVPTLDLRTPWVAVLVLAAGALVLLAVCSALLGRGVLRRATLARVKESA